MTFPRYSKYRDSGFEWLHEVPQHWELKRLSHFFEERREKVSDTEFAPLSVTKNGIVPQLDTAAKTQDGDNRKKVVAGDFVINSRSDRKGSAGLATTDGSVSLICTVLKPLALEGSFVHHLLRSVPFQEEYYRWGKGIVADLWSTNFSDMKNIVLGIPSPEEQTQIARFLDYETARIDALIEEQQRLIELLKEKRQAVISHAVTKGLDPNVEMKDSGVEWLGEVPAHWKITKLKHIGSLNPPKSEFAGEKSVLCSFVPMEKLKTDSLKLDESRVVEEVFDGYTYFIEGDVLFAKVTPCFENRNAAIATSLENGIGFGSSEIFVFRPLNVFNRFLFFRLLEDILVNYWTSEMTGAGGLKRVPAIVVENYIIATPGEVEQKAIASYLDKKIQSINNLIEKADTSVALLIERRAALVSAAVTGKIDVRNWQPPADNKKYPAQQEAAHG